MTAKEHDKIGQTELSKRIAAATAGLWYMSESDAEIFPFTGRQSLGVKKEFLLEQIGRPEGTPVEERGFDEMFARFITLKEWFTEKQRTDAIRFSELKLLLSENLSELKVFKVGLIQVDIFFVGLDAEGCLTGIQTKAIET
jgi:Nuclease A inhibitor-like protein